MRAAIYQANTTGLTPTQRHDKLAATLEKNQADLIVCPELFMSGYNVGANVAKCAEPSDGPFAERITNLAKSTNTAIVYGYPERDGDTLYNAAICIDANGTTVANHRKILLPPLSERDHFSEGQGSTLFELNGKKVGLLICYEAEFPEAVRATSLAGAEVIVVPTALSHDWPTVAHHMMPTRAFENGVWFLYANHAGTENNLTYLGGSAIIAPNGTDAARAGPDEETIAYDLDFSAIPPARKRLPYLTDIPRLKQRLST